MSAQDTRTFKRPRSNKLPERRFFPAGRSVRIPPGQLAVVQSGVVRLETIQDDGSSSIIGFHRAGEALIHHIDRLCHVHPVAHSDVLLGLHELDPADSVQDALIQRLREMEAWLAMLAHRGATNRLQALLELEWHRRTATDGEPIRLTRDQLAMATLTSRASVARALRTLRRMKSGQSMGEDRRGEP